MIERETIERVYAAARIEEVVGDYVVLRKRGANLVGLCPFHNERTPSFSVSPGRNTCKCFGCGKGGGPVNFVMEVEKIDYPDAIRLLAKKYNIEVKETAPSEEDREAQSEREAMFSVNEYAHKFFQDVLWNDPTGRAVGLSYFRQRGFSDETIKAFGLGFCLDSFDDFSKKALAKGFRKEVLLSTGLSTESQRGSLVDRFRGRAIFPVYTRTGKIVAFGGRVLVKDDKTAKYVNSPESNIYSKSHELYGLFQAYRQMRLENKCYLVEGYADVISVHQAGVLNVVASSGTSLTDGQVGLIRQVIGENGKVTLLYDGDEAGIHASLRAMDMLLTVGLDVKIALWPEGEDPDSFAQSHNADEFIAYVNSHETDAIECKLRLLRAQLGDDPRSRTEIVRQVAQSIAVIPDEILRAEYVRDFAVKMNVAEDALLRAVAETVENNRKEQQKRESIQSNPITTPSASQPASAPETAAASAKQETRLPVGGTAPQECNLLSALIQYGHSKIYFQWDPETQLLSPSDQQTVLPPNCELMEFDTVDYIRGGLEDNGMSFGNPQLAALYEEAVGYKGNIEAHFTNHPDLDTQHLVSKILGSHIVDTEEARNERPDLKRAQIVHRVLLEFQNAVLVERRRQLLQQMQDPDLSEEEKDGLVQQQMQLNEIIKGISKLLGERTYKV